MDRKERKKEERKPKSKKKQPTTSLVGAEREGAANRTAAREKEREREREREIYRIVLRFVGLHSIGVLPSFFFTELFCGRFDEVTALPYKGISRREPGLWCRHLFLLLLLLLLPLALVGIQFPTRTLSVLRKISIISLMCTL